MEPDEGEELLLEQCQQLSQPHWALNTGDVVATLSPMIVDQVPAQSLPRVHWPQTLAQSAIKSF